MTEAQYYEIRLKDLFSGKLQEIENKLNGFENKLKNTGSIMGDVFGGNVLSDAFSKTIDLIKDATLATIDLGMEMEKTRIKMNVLLQRGPEFSNMMISQFQSFAKDTPFSTKGVLDAATMLTAYQFKAEELIPTMTKLGDVSAALNLDFKDMAWLYGTTKSEGRLMSKDMNQFATRGIPIIKGIADYFGIATKEVRKYVKEGKVTFEVVEKIFDKMTAKGGIFGGLMNELSKSAAGRWERFKDSIEIMATAFGERLLPYLKDGLDILFNIVDTVKNMDWSEWIDPLASIWDSLVNIWDKFASITELKTLFVLALEGVKIIAKEILLIVETLAATIEYAITKFEKFKNNSGRTGILKGVDENGEAIVDWDKTPEEILDDKLKKAFESFTGSGTKTDFSFAPAPGPKDWYGKGKGGKNGAGSEDSGYGSAGLEKISSGTRNIHVNITTLVGTIEFQKSYESSEIKMIEMVKKALVGLVNDVNIVAN